MYWIKLYVTCGRSVVFTRYSTNKTDRPAITEILLKVAVETITITLNLATKTTLTSLFVQRIFVLKIQKD
jgi:hypothetical protein